MDTAIAVVTPPSTQWQHICALDDIPPWCGVAALVDGHQVALLRWGEADQVYALANFDPFSKAMVISRGIIGDQQGAPTVASPVYKQRFRLDDGVCLDDPQVRLRTWPVQVVEGRVGIAIG